MAACPRTSMCTVGGDSSCARAPHLVTRAGEVIESEGTPPSAPPVPDTPQQRHDASRGTGGARPAAASTELTSARSGPTDETRDVASPRRGPAAAVARPTAAHRGPADAATGTCCGAVRPRDRRARHRCPSPRSHCRDAGTYRSEQRSDRSFRGRLPSLIGGTSLRHHLNDSSSGTCSYTTRGQQVHRVLTAGPTAPAAGRPTAHAGAAGDDQGPAAAEPVAADAPAGPPGRHSRSTRR